MNTRFTRLLARAKKLAPAAAVAAVVGLTGGALAQRFAADCCAPGAACCQPGAACCHHDGAQAKR